MTSYKITTSNDNITVNLTSSTNKVDVTSPSYQVSLSRTGGQGSKGDTITDAYFDVNKNLIIEVTNSSGEVSTINAGNLNSAISLRDIGGVTVSNASEGDLLVYSETSSTFENHKLTTTNLIDIDNTSVANGAVLVYNGTTTKYTATTTILGGTF